MNIKTSDLKTFQKMSSHLVGNKILPICDYLKFGDGKIVKNVLTGFFEYDCKEADEELLVDQNDLFSLVGEATSQFVSVYKKSGKTYISDGSNTLTLKTANPKEFPVHQKPDAKKVILDGEFLTSLLAASAFAQPMGEIPNAFMYVHVGGGAICANDNVIGYHSPIECQLTMVLEKKIASLVAKTDVEFFSETPNYYFFYHIDGHVFGFAKQSIGWMDIRKYFSADSVFEFSASDSDLLSFNRLSLKITSCPTVTLSTGKYEMYDAGTEKSQVRPDESVKLTEPFSYSPSGMNRLIEALGCKKLDFHDGGSFFYVKSPDAKATAIIAKISK